MSRRPGRSRRRAAVLVAVIVVAVCGPATPARGATVLTGLEGGVLDSDELEQGSWIAVVWASWSPRCRDVVPRINALVENWGSQARVIAVDFQEEVGEVRAFLEGKQLLAPVYLDRDAAFSKRYAVTHLPGLLVLRDGDVAFRGRLPRDPSDLLARAFQ